MSEIALWYLECEIVSFNVKFDRVKLLKYVWIILVFWNDLVAYNFFWAFECMQRNNHQIIIKTKKIVQNCVFILNM